MSVVADLSSTSADLSGVRDALRRLIQIDADPGAILGLMTVARTLG